MSGLTRREFLFLGAAAGAGVAVGVVVPLTRLSDAPAGAGSAVAQFFSRTRIGSLTSLVPGEPVLFDYPLAGQASMLVRLTAATETGMGPDQDVVAFSRVCTHMGCVIDEFRSDVDALGPCPCHFTTFDLAKGGQVILGQATQNLPQVLIDIEDDDIYATGVVRLVYGYHNTLGLAEVSA